MTVRASIDLGTQTCLLLLAEWDPSRREIKRVIRDESTIVRLGQGVDKSGELHPDAIERTRNCLVKYAGWVREAGGKTEDAICVGTAQARDARNAREFFGRIEQETGFKFRVLTGDEEARFTFEGGLLPGMNAAQSAVIDIGGGSTELMALQGGQSINIGAVRFTERFLKSDPVTDDEFWACQAAVDEALEVLRSWRKGLPNGIQLVGVAGTATTLAGWHLGLKTFDATKINEVTLSRGDIHRMVEELKWRTVAERRELPSVEAGRADVLLAGSLILWRAMETLHFESIRISTRGLRYGTLKNLS